jgi:hypothetical protein
MEAGFVTVFETHLTILPLPKGSNIKSPLQNCEHLLYIQGGEVFPTYSIPYLIVSLGWFAKETSYGDDEAFVKFDVHFLDKSLGVSKTNKQ